MNLSADDRQRNRHQFDSLFKKILRDEARNAQREIALRREREMSLAEMTDSQQNSLAVLDEYPSDSVWYQVQGFDVAVRDDLLSDALDALPLRKREVVLLSYFLDMSDVEIARLLGYTPANIHYHRTSALGTLKKLMKQEENPHDENQSQA